jgi:Tol biopolymer transport system component
VSHTWSSDGNEIFCIVKRDSSFLFQILPALYRSAPKRTFSLDGMDAAFRADLSRGSAYVVRWIGDQVYMRGFDFLWRFSLASGAVQRVTGSPDLQIREVSVRADERKLVFDHAQEIWIADLDGRNSSQLTKDNSRDYAPDWIRRGAEWWIVFSSNRGGQNDLWWLEPRSRFVQRLTSGGVDEKRVEDCSRDGSLLIYRAIKAKANLWSYNHRTGTRNPLTTEALSDSAPSVAPNAARLAFQRIQPKLVEGSRLIDTEIWLADIRFPELALPHRIIQDGGAPLLSPDGRWMTYLHYHKGGRLFELRLHDLTTNQDSLVSSRIRIDELSDVPLDWGPDDIAWSPDGSSLYFVESGEKGATTLKRLRLDLDGPSGEIETIAVNGPGARIMEPKIASDGSSLLYSLLATGDLRSWEVRRRELPSGREQTVFSENGPYRLYCMGWLGQAILALRSHLRDSEGFPPGRLEILRIDRSGRWNQIGHLDRAYGQTALFDPGRGALYVTAVESGIPNIKACYPASGTCLKVTDNQWPDITFSGLQMSGPGMLLYSQEEHASDLYLAQFRH